MSDSRQTTRPPVLRVEDLDKLDSKILVARVRPILKRAGLIGAAVPSHVVKHHLENVPFALWTLAHDWLDGDVTDGHRVPFHEYVAARLPRLLVKIDKPQRPEQYDRSTNTYAPVEAPAAIVADDGVVTDETDVEPPTLTEILTCLKAGMEVANIAVASQMALIRTVSAVASDRAAGVEMSPYRMGVATSAADRVHGLLDTTAEDYQRAYDDAVNLLRGDAA